MDISMPFKDGYQASKEIRQLCEIHSIEQPYIIACTGHTEQQYIQQAWECQIDEVLPKPASVDIMVSILSNFLKFSSEWHSNYIITIL